MTKPLRPICPHCKQRIRPPLTEAQKARARERARAQYLRTKTPS